jgi:hypothetical protein
MLARLPALDEELMRTVLVVRGAGHPPPSPADYAPRVVERVRPVHWRAQVLALVRRPPPITLESAQEQATEFLRRATDLTAGQREFLRRLELGELRPDLLASPEIEQRVALNPALQWRLRAGAEALEER